MTNRIPSVALKGEELKKFSEELLICASHQELDDHPLILGAYEAQSTEFIRIVRDFLGIMGGRSQDYYEAGQPLSYATLYEDAAASALNLQTDKIQFDASLHVAAEIAKHVYIDHLPNPLRPE